MGKKSKSETPFHHISAFGFPSEADGKMLSYYPFGLLEPSSALEGSLFESLGA